MDPVSRYLPCVTKTRVPAVDGLFTEVDGVAHLIGAKTPDRESYFFPPTCPAWRAVTGRRRRRTEEVLLSNTGTVWSYTTSSMRRRLRSSPTLTPTSPSPSQR